MRRGQALVGWGMAGGVWEATQLKAAAPGGAHRRRQAHSLEPPTEDIGTGTYTIMTQIAAESLGFWINDVTFLLGA